LKNKDDFAAMQPGRSTLKSKGGPK
jgi:hypothetical protein